MTWFANSAKWSEMAEDDFTRQWSGKETQERMLALKRTTDAVFQGLTSLKMTEKKRHSATSCQMRIWACAPSGGKFAMILMTGGGRVS